ncbi:MAG: TPM domain-containing protein [Rhodocyclaceae bacterium]|nr:TPM domain-containing protein [Rhodocyclaceae bacterium]MDZ4214356.1 TPM domain-containing protein [Rhodocyclaceae bacterium]
MFRHLSYPPWRTRRAFPPATRRAIETAVAASESSHRGELRFVVEGGLDLPLLLRGVDAHTRAIDLFAQLHVWDTEENSGVLIYVQLADRRVEIVADRGINVRVGSTGWQAICRDMEQAFAAGQFEAGALSGLAAIGRLLAAHFPAGIDNPDELTNAPTLL